MHQERFLECLSAEIRSVGPVPRHLVLLSAGLDSLAVLAALRRHLGPRAEIVTATAAGPESREGEVAWIVSAYFRTRHVEVPFAEQDFLDDIPLLSGTGETTLFSAILRRMTERILDTVGDVPGGAVYMGEGADTLLGTWSPYVYMETNVVAQELGIPAREAREVLRRRARVREMARTEAYAPVISRREGTLVAPFQSRFFDWVLDVPMATIGSDKRWVREALRVFWGIPDLSRRRIPLQTGLGWYESIKARMGGRRANATIRDLCR